MFGRAIIGIGRKCFQKTSVVQCPIMCTRLTVLTPRSVLHGAQVCGAAARSVPFRFAKAEGDGMVLQAAPQQARLAAGLNTLTAGLGA